jgi:hypothetical protein
MSLYLGWAIIETLFTAYWKYSCSFVSCEPYEDFPQYLKLLPHSNACFVSHVYEIESETQTEYSILEPRYVTPSFAFLYFNLPYTAVFLPHTLWTNYSKCGNQITLYSVLKWEWLDTNTVIIKLDGIWIYSKTCLIQNSIIQILIWTYIQKGKKIHTNLPGYFENLDNS